MVKKDKYEHEFFVPAKFIVGIGKNGSGFPSMKTIDGKWTNLSIFENHCNYKPNVQRDKNKEILKTFSQAVQEVENIPTSGFRLKNVSKKVYHTELYKDVNCVLLQDPRGWDVQIEASEFQEILAANGMNVKDGELLDIKLVYCWRSHHNGTPFSLNVADKSILDMQDATNKLFNNKNCAEYIKPSQFKIGNVYTSKQSNLAGHLYMYMGTHDVYSDDCQYNALVKKGYAGIWNFIDDKKDITQKDRHVFYCLDPDYLHDTCYYEHWLLSNTPGYSPYYVVSSLSKLSESDVTGKIDATKYFMHNDKHKIASYDNIKADMETSAYFNKLDFNNVSVENVSYGLLEQTYAELVDAKSNCEKSFELTLMSYPFYLSINRPYIALNSNSNPTLKNFTIALDSKHDFLSNKSTAKKYALRRARIKNEYNSFSYYDREFASYPIADGTNDSKKAAFKQLFDTLGVYVKKYRFCNGKAVPEVQNLALNVMLK